MNAHPRIAELAALDIDFGLSAGDRTELERHLEDCEPCRILLRAYRADAEALKAVAFGHAPARVRTAVLGAASRPVARNPFAQLLVAAALVGLLLIGLVLAAGALRNDDRRLVDATVQPTPLISSSPTRPPISETPTALASPPARSLTPTIGGLPPNDNPPGTAIGSLPFTDSVDTTLAQIHAQEQSSTCGSGSQSVWYSYTADQSITLVADTFGSGYDTILDIWKGSLTSDYQSPGFETLVPLACNDNAGDSVQSEVVFAAIAGQAYTIRVTSGGGTGVGGALTFHLARG